MDGRVIQKFRQAGEEGRTLYLLADDSAANREEAAHTPIGAAVWLNSGEQGTLAAPADGKPLDFPRLIAKVPGDYMPKGDRFTTSRAQAVAWLKELADKAIPSPLLVGATVWAQKYRPIKARVDAAAAQKDIDGLWRVLQEIRAMPVGAAVAAVTGQAKTQSAQAYQALKLLPVAELQKRAEKVRQDLDDMRPKLGILSDDNSRAYDTALEQVKFQLRNASEAKTDEERRTFLARAVHTGEETVRRFIKSPSSSILDTARETADKAKDAAGSALELAWDAIPTPVKIVGGALLAALATQAVAGLFQGRRDDDEDD